MSDINTLPINQNELIDIKEIAINKDLLLKERLYDYINKIKNPYLYKYKKIVVSVSFSDVDINFEDIVINMNTDKH